MQKYTQYFYVFLFIFIFVVYRVSLRNIVSGSGTSILEFGYSLDLQKKTAPGRWFCMQFPYPSVSHRGNTRRSEAEISPVSPLHSLNLKVWRSSTQRDVSETDWAQRFEKGFEKKGCILSESIIMDILLMDRSSFWWVFSLMWYDAESWVLWEDKTTLLKPEPEAGAVCCHQLGVFFFVGSSIHRGVVNEISKSRIFSCCVSTSMLHISLGLYIGEGCKKL